MTRKVKWRRVTIQRGKMQDEDIELIERSVEEQKKINKEIIESIRKKQKER